MPTTQDTAKLLDLKRRIRDLSPSDKLRFCADLLDSGSQFRDITETLISEVVDGLRTLGLFNKPQSSK